jgi:hypothetical protein
MKLTPAQISLLGDVEFEIGLMFGGYSPTERPLRRERWSIVTGEITDVFWSGPKGAPDNRVSYSTRQQMKKGT